MQIQQRDGMSQKTNPYPHHHQGIEKNKLLGGSII